MEKIKSIEEELLIRIIEYPWRIKKEGGINRLSCKIAFREV